MDGAEVRLGRLFGRESGRSFIVAIDHGLASGALPGAEDAPGAVERLVSCDPDGVLLSPGMMARAGHLFAFRGASSPLVRGDFLILDQRLEDLGEQHRVLCTPEEAASMGADAITMFLVLGAEEGSMFADNARAVARAAREAHRVGIPLIVETVLWGSRITDRRDPDLLTLGCRMAAELGADAIKTEYTGDPQTMKPVVEGCPAPVLVLGGPRMDSEEDLLTATEGAISAGVRGVVYGRNIWQADDPRRVSAGIRKILHGAER
jgi:DhnA family fructose-bisphosphate aldolase class Ia